MMLDDGLYFEYALAHDLGLTVEGMRQEMPLSEFYGWSAFYKRRKAESPGGQR